MTMALAKARTAGLPFRAAWKRSQKEVEALLRQRFQEQARGIADSFEANRSITYHWPVDEAWRRSLVAALARVYAAGYAGRRLAKADLVFTDDDLVEYYPSTYQPESYALTNSKANDWAWQHSGSLITNIDDTTRDMVQQQIANSFSDANYTIGELKSDIQGFIEDAADWRVDMIARTEMGMAANSGNLDAYKDNGTHYVMVHDGDDFDEECQAADGQIWTIEEADANPLEHPNCTRYFDEISDEEAAAAGEESGTPEGEVPVPEGSEVVEPPVDPWSLIPDTTGWDQAPQALKDQLTPMLERLQAENPVQMDFFRYTDFVNSPNAYAHAAEPHHGLGGFGIEFNSRWFSNMERFEAQYASDIRGGFHPPMENLTPAQATLAHEYGHVVDFQGDWGKVSTYTSDRLRASEFVYSHVEMEGTQYEYQTLDKLNMPMISEYAKKSAYEAWAEAFAAYIDGGDFTGTLWDKRIRDATHYVRDRLHGDSLQWAVGRAGRRGVYQKDPWAWVEAERLRAAEERAARLAAGGV